MRCLTRHHQFRSLLRECARRSSLPTGKKLHAVIVTTGLANTPKSFLNNTLLQFYAACNDTPSAHKLFDKIPLPHKDVVDWTALMSSFAKSQFPGNALRLFVDMRREGVEVDDVTMVCLFGVCAFLEDLWMGSQGHGCAVKIGLSSFVKVCNAGMDMYGKCGLVEEVKRLFEEMSDRNVVSWTVVLDTVSRFEGVENGRKVFDEMPERNEVAWTVMIAGYVGNGYPRESFKLLREMLFTSGYLNFVTLCSILSACARSGAALMGMWVHVYALKTRTGRNAMNIMVGTSLIDMYAKCGRINLAFEVFTQMVEKNVVTWNAMLSGLAMHGRGRVVLDIFPEMMIEGIKPDDVTLTAVLNACSHSGLVSQGRNYFNNLESVYGLKPKAEHYACMVDLLGRAGCLEEAEVLIKKMPISPNEVVLGSLLGSCSVHGKVELGERVLRDLIRTYPFNTEYHVLLSNMYALAGRHETANSIRRGIRKTPGMSFINVRGQVHQFSAGDMSHPRIQEVYLELDDVIRKLRRGGYVPNSSFQVFPWGDGSSSNVNTGELEEKEHALFTHSEKLAVCFGLISTKPGMSLYIFKNLRICRDCHSAFKILSKVYNREVTVRDRSRFHCFKHGTCSCSDYW